jgi:hypothetical protein
MSEHRRSRAASYQARERAGAERRQMDEVAS